MIDDFSIAHGEFVGGADEFPEKCGNQICTEMHHNRPNFNPSAMSLWIENITVIEAACLRLKEGIGLT